MITDDVSAWHKYPHHRNWFNKLWLSEQLGYCCGPGGVPVPEKNLYIVRPIYNLRGMGAGAKIKEITTEDLISVPPGYFWCEIFQGNHYSIDLEWDNKWHLVSVFQGVNSPDKLYKFEKWIKKDLIWQAPSFLDTLQDCVYINVEVIGDKIIEVHLRTSPDPNYTEIIPVWENEKISVSHEYTWIESFDDADGFIEQKRLGFFVK